MKVRPLQPDDQTEWLRLRRALWTDHSEDQICGDVAKYWSDGTICGMPSAVFVVERGGEPRRLGGFLEASLRPYAHGCCTMPVGYIEGWYVEPALRRSGVGRELVHAAERWARDRGCSEMGSDCRDANTISYLAHQRLGYRPTIGSVLFRKDLSPQVERPPTAERPDIIALIDCPTFAQSAIDHVSDPRAGGIDVFLGTTRCQTASDGRALLALDYEAYHEMALKQMHDLARHAREKWPIVKLALIHRFGRVALGEPSIVIAVSCPHRGDAFDACRFLIDTLKAEVAIWKKEVWDDGTHTWVNPP